MITYDLPDGAPASSERVQLRLDDQELVAVDAGIGRQIRFGQLGPYERELLTSVRRVVGVEAGPHGALSVEFAWQGGEVHG